MDKDIKKTDRILSIISIIVSVVGIILTIVTNQNFNSLKDFFMGNIGIILIIVGVIGFAFSYIRQQNQIFNKLKSIEKNIETDKKHFFKTLNNIEKKNTNNLKIHNEQINMLFEDMKKQ